jgi:hypothetical protein
LPTVYLLKNDIFQLLNEPPRGKRRGIFKGKIHFIAASCGELNPIDFASPFKGFV